MYVLLLKFSKRIILVRMMMTTVDGRYMRLLSFLYYAYSSTYFSDIVSHQGQNTTG